MLLSLAIATPSATIFETSDAAEVGDVSNTAGPGREPVAVEFACVSSGTCRSAGVAEVSDNTTAEGAGGVGSLEGKAPGGRHDRTKIECHHATH